MDMKKIENFTREELINFIKTNSKIDDFKI